MNLTNSLKPRAGFTTGTCAQAATKGACLMLLRQSKVEAVEIKTPSGAKLKLGLIDQSISKGYARCAVIKDSGDDIDVTDGAKIYAKVRLADAAGVTIKGGQGVGKATKPGLAIAAGEYAINPTPRRMILEEALKIFSTEKAGLEITISVANGRELAKRTFNPRLGITGGISIIGTTGIVEPKSLDAYKASLALQLNVLKAQGYNKAIFVLGYVGENFCKNNLKVGQGSLIKIGDHVGFMLEECAKKKMKEVLLIGHIGKLIKLTNGQFNTHYSFGDNRLECIARYAGDCGADKNIIAEILGQKTAEAAIVILEKAGLSQVFKQIASDLSKKCEEFINNKAIVNCILLSLDAKVLSRTDGANPA